MFYSKSNVLDEYLTLQITNECKQEEIFKHTHTRIHACTHLHKQNVAFVHSHIQRHRNTRFLSG